MEVVQLGWRVYCSASPSEVQVDIWLNISPQEFPPLQFLVCLPLIDPSQYLENATDLFMTTNQIMCNSETERSTLNADSVTASFEEMSLRDPFNNEGANRGLLDGIVDWQPYALSSY